MSSEAIDDVKAGVIDEGMLNGVKVLGEDCRRHIVSIQNMLRYARDMSFRDPKRVVEALGVALEEVAEFSVDLELVLGGVATVIKRASGEVLIDQDESDEEARIGPLMVQEAEVLPLVVGETGIGREVTVSNLSNGEGVAEQAYPGASRRRSRDDAKGLVFADEQLAVIECDADDCAVDSGAGCGKTSTLVGYARARPGQRMLYIAFSRSVADEAKKKFPSHVRCINQHSLAFSAVGHRFADKLGNPKARQVLAYLEDKKRLPTMQEHDRDAFCQMALETVEEFIAGTGWAPEIVTSDAQDGYLLPSGRYIEGRFVAAAAQSVWEGMQDIHERRIPMVPDGYCKLWALTRPDLSMYRKILLDEGQDANGSLLQVLLSQHTGRVFVGDDRQRIFGFRKAVNAMDMLPGAQRRVLRTSYRFGPGIAQMANDLLSVFLPGGQELIGGGGDREPDGSTAVIFRTNAGLFSAAAEWIDLRDGRSTARTSGVMSEIRSDRGLHFVGGLAAYQFESIVDTYRVKAGERSQVRDAFLRRFTSYEGLVGYAEQVKDRELLARISVVDRFGERVPYLAEEMKRAHVSADRANTSLCSAHRSKGLEWDHVAFGEDFPALMNMQGAPRAMSFNSCEEEVTDILSDEEVRLLYVAMTRGRKTVQPSRAIRDFLDWKGRQQAAQ